MKRLKLWLVIIALIAAAALSRAFTAKAGGAFPDIREGDWYYSAVTLLYMSGVVSGFDDGNFYPDGTLTAAQFLKLLFYDSGGPASEGEEWWRPYYRAGIEAGIVDEAALTEADMDRPLSRYRAALMISGLGVETGAPEGFRAVYDAAALRSEIEDLASVPPEYVSAVTDVCAAGIMRGYGDGRFHGEEELTRAQAAQIIVRLRDESQRRPLVRYVSLDDEPAGDEWFSDALIVGNSLAGGLANYGGLRTATIFYCNGVSVYGAEEAGFSGRGGAVMGIDDVLKSGEYGKVLLVFGTNEMASDPERFFDEYCAFIDEIRSCQPGAEIYVHNAPPVNETMSEYPEVFNNENVARANEVIGRVAEEKGLTVIDVYSLFAGEDGELPAEATWDGIHFNGSLYEVWADFLRSAVA